MRYKEDFIDLMVESGVLTFGDFTTKSGRKTPFFINTGNYHTGEQLSKLGDFYAMALIHALGTEFDVLYGPAYKGIPLAAATAISLHSKHSKDAAYCFNRKEVKDHGEGGSIIGHKLQDGERIVIVEDVITAGTSVRESVPLLKGQAKVHIEALVVSVDRMERGVGILSALQEAQNEFGVKPISIVNIEEIVEYLYNKRIHGTIFIDDEMKARIDEYRAQYGV